MSVTSTRHSTGQKPRFQGHISYKPFALPLNTRPEALAAHVMAWLLSNMDWLMQHGGATQSRALLGLPRDLLKLVGDPAADAPPQPTTEEMEALEAKCQE